MKFGSVCSCIEPLTLAVAKLSMDTESGCVAPTADGGEADSQPRTKKVKTETEDGQSQCDEETGDKSNEAEEASENDLESGIQFFPPAYLQRYCRVRDTLESRLEQLEPEKSVSILEVGCAEFGMHFHFKSLKKVEKVIYVDVDKDLLTRKLFAINPLPYDQLSPRETPLTFEVYAGCVTQADARIKNADPPLFAIVGIEILEHLNKDVEEKFVYTIFKKYAPPVVILTTPNGDFNPVLGLEKGKFRHWDHRFELTREEFRNWCSMVCENFPQYEFHIEGIAEGPEGSEELGCLSQMAVFERKRDITEVPAKSYVFKNDAFRIDRISKESTAVQDESVISDNNYFEGQSSDEPYELLRCVDYPWKPKPPLQERVVEEVVYHIHSYFLHPSSLESHYENGGGDVISMEWGRVREILHNKFEFEVKDLEDNVIA